MQHNFSPTRSVTSSNTECQVLRQTMPSSLQQPNITSESYTISHMLTFSNHSSETCPQ